MELLKIEDPLCLYDKIRSTFCDIYDTARINIQTKKRENQPWANDVLLSMIQNKDSLFRKWKSMPINNNYRLEYTKYRNKVQKLINKAKNNYKKNDICNCKGDMRKIWGKINQWIGKNKSSVDTIIERYMQ